MKRIVLLFLVLLILLFSGCNKNTDTPSQNETVVDTKIENLTRVQEAFDGALAAAVKDGKWGYISKDGKWYIEPSFISADNFNFGAAAVCVNDAQKGEVFGYISSNGKYIDFLHPEFKSAGAFSKDGVAKVTENVSDYFYINKK